MIFGHGCVFITLHYITILKRLIISMLIDPINLHKKKQFYYSTQRKNYNSLFHKFPLCPSFNMEAGCLNYSNSLFFFGLNKTQINHLHLIQNANSRLTESPRYFHITPISPPFTLYLCNTGLISKS